MRTATDTLLAWSTLTSGATNSIRVGDVDYFWTVSPRVQKNGALVGEMHEKKRGESMREIGSYKIRADGSVELLPAPLRGILDTPELTKEEEKLATRTSFDGEGVESECSWFNDYVGRGVGGEVVVFAGAPGTGRWIYRISRITPDAVFGVEVGNSVRELSPSEVA